jgi:DNA-binding CsgD family transcriptional regulator/pimeloyl-ACP methyl ester carboxylesterase
VGEQRQRAGEVAVPAPPIHYAHTSDGVNIAYVDEGEGYPVVFVPIVPFSHIQESWDAWGHGPFAKQLRLIAYDPRGFGLSGQPDTVDYSIPAMLRDLKAVLTKAGLDRFAIYSRHSGVPVAVAGAAEWPDRVTHLICVDGWASFRQTPLQQKESPAEIHQRVVAWHRYEKHMLEKCPWLDRAPTGRSTHLVRLSDERHDAWQPPPMLFARAVEAVERYDLRDALEKVKCPTLIVQAPRHPWVPRGAAPELAARLVGAQLLAEDGADSGRLAHLLARFIASSEPAGTTRPRSTTPAAQLTAREREVLALIAAGKTDGQIAAELTIAVATASRHVHNILEKLDDLTRRETEILALITAGRTNRQIAEALTIAPSTVDRHVQNIYGKTGVHNRAEATLWAVTHGLVAP